MGIKRFTLEALDVNKKDQIPTHIRTPCSVRTALTCFCDLNCIPTRNIIRVLSDYAKDSTEAQTLLNLTDISSIEAKQQYITQIETPKQTLLSIFQKYPSIEIPLDHLLEILPIIPKRYYSISNYLPENSPNPQLEFTFSIFNQSPSEENHAFTDYGICSNWMKQLAKEAKQLDPLPTDTLMSPSRALEEEKLFLNNIELALPSNHGYYLPIIPRNITNFRLPLDLSIPVIMVATGTGISPFRGYLQYRKYQKQKVPNLELADAWLFYGCRHPERDFLFPELENFGQEGLVNLRTAFSRLNPDKVYVQQRLREESNIIYNLMVYKNARIYICGEANEMVKSVKETLISIINAESHKTTGNDLLASWISEKRFLLDIW